AKAAKAPRAEKATKAPKEPKAKAKDKPKAEKATRAAKVAKTPADATAKTEQTAAKRAGAGSGHRPPPGYNQALPFIEFVGAHPVGTNVDGVVEQFSSHGAYVQVD